jgi:hypothetical protein
MVGHQAIGTDDQAPCGGILLEELEIPSPLGVAVEDVLTAVAALRDVMGPTRNHDSGSARHTLLLTRAARHVKAAVAKNG